MSKNLLPGLNGTCLMCECPVKEDRYRFKGKSCCSRECLIEWARRDFKWDVWLAKFSEEDLK